MTNISLDILYILMGFCLGIILGGMLAAPSEPVNGCILYEDVVYCEVAE